MRASVSQLILDFEPPVGTRDDAVGLLIFRSEQEYFATKSPTPEFKVQLPRPFQETALMDEGSWREKPRPADAARDLGHRMWLNLPEQVRESILEGNPTAPQRVAIMSTHCGMDDVPWEWLTGDNQQPIATDERIRFVRVVPALYASPPLNVAPPIRVLIVLTNPKEKRLLDPEIELNVITEGLQQDNRYQFEVLMQPRLASLKERLNSFSPHIIHYVGHSGISGSMGNLILHDQGAGARWVSAPDLSRILPSSVRLLCLSTCVTTKNYQIGGLAKFAHCSSETQLPTVITNQYAVTEDSARHFWRTFYPALLEFKGDTVEALHRARQKVFEATTDTWNWASFSMVVRDGSGHAFKIESTASTDERYSLDLQAQWSARAANSLATQMRSMSEDVQQHWESTLESEVARTESLESELDNY